jgi:hypothetical protein
MRRLFVSFGAVIGSVAPVSTETPFSSVSSFPCGRSRALRKTATPAPATRSPRIAMLRRIRRRTRRRQVCQRRTTP